MERRRAYDAEFKKGAIRLVTEGGKRVSEVARDLGVSSNQLYRWIKQMESDREGAFPGKGRLKPEDEHLRRLERELRDIREERDILKKAISIFSKVKP
jgi:transposase